MSWSTVPEALAEMRAGRPLVVTDAPDRENEADLVVAAELATPEVVNFMVTHGRGLVCVPMEASRLAELELSLMVTNNTTPNGTAFTVPVDVREGTTTGISAFERARTIHALIDPATRPEDLLRPGHMFPLRAHADGLMARAGHTEAAVELARLAGLYPAGVVCEILAEDGTMARGASLAAFAERHGLRRLAIADLVAWLKAGEEVAAVTKTEARDTPAPVGGPRTPIAALAAGD
jgi:3,4-dihydroxy 2-butanone 4-phosphate synthase/GTP cyclohydrolase II